MKEWEPTSIRKLLDEYVERELVNSRMDSRDLPEEMKQILKDRFGPTAYLEGLLLVLDELSPELLKIAGNGLPMQGERRLRKRLGLTE